MRQSIEEYVMRCDKCQTRKGKHDIRAPLGDVDPSETYQVTSMDITGPYCVTLRKNRYLPTFTDHFTKYVEVFTNQGVSAKNLC